MVERIYDIAIALFGLLALLFNKRFAENAVSFWNRVLDNYYGDNAVGMFRVGFVIAGCAFVAYGMRDLW